LGITIISCGTPGSRGFALSLASSFSGGASLVEVDYKRFPDGEDYVRVPVDPDGRAVVVCTFSRPQSESLLRSILVADASRELGFKSLALIAPYLAFSRQDRAFLRGEPVSIRAVLRSLYASGYEELYTVEIHKEESLRFFPGRAMSVDPFAFMAAEIGIDCPETVIVAPDMGALPRARRVASAVGCEYGYMVKRRDRVTGEIEVREGEGLNIGGMRVVLVDDVISTGGTIAEASRILLSKGASRVEVIVAHYLGLEGAEERLREGGVSTVYAANTLPPTSSGMVKYIDVAPLVAEVLGA